MEGSVNLDKQYLTLGYVKYNVYEYKVSQNHGIHY